MKRVVWLTDIHLNFLSAERIDRFLGEVRAERPAAVLISGDIAEAHDLVDYLKSIDDALRVPVYFVLGNHDYYFGAIAAVRARVNELCEERPFLKYLTTADAVALTDDVGLIGHDGWADGRLGDYERSMVSMYDYKLIEDLAGRSKAARWEVLKRLGDEAAAHIVRVLPAALERYAHVVLLTHVPPVHEACWHEGHLSDDQWAPHFTCKAVGDVLLRVMPQWPDRKLTVLCGHTHGCGQTEPLPNLRIYTGGARYGEPEIQQVFEWE